MTTVCTTKDSQVEFKIWKKNDNCNATGKQRRYEIEK